MNRHVQNENNTPLTEKKTLIRLRKNKYKYP